MRADLALDDVLAALGEPHLVGSAALGLMVWPDLDVTVVCDSLDVAALHVAAADLVRHPRVRQLTFRNDAGPWNTQPDTYPDGIYWGIDYRDGRRTWNIDIWFVVDADRQPDLRHVRDLPARLTPETRRHDPRDQAGLGGATRVRPRRDVVRHLHGRARPRHPDAGGVRALPTAPDATGAVDDARQGTLSCQVTP